MSSDESPVEPPEPAVEEVEPAAQDGATTASRAAELPRWALLGSAAFALAALIAAAVFGIQWWVDSSGDNVGLAQAREQVVTAGRTAIKAYTEVDYQNLDQFFKNQQDISDAAMKDQLTKSEATYRKALTDAKTKVTTTIDDIGVEELDSRAGKAKFLAAVSLQVAQADKTGVKAIRLEVQMTRADDNGKQAWKLTGIGDVPLVASGQ